MANQFKVFKILEKQCKLNYNSRLRNECKNNVKFMKSKFSNLKSVTELIYFSFKINAFNYHSAI